MMNAAKGLTFLMPIRLYDEFDGELNYDEEYGGQLCADCAISDTSSNINLGRAIDMMNGDEDYDDDFVREHL